MTKRDYSSKSNKKTILKPFLLNHKLKEGDSIVCSEEHDLVNRWHPECNDAPQG
jgi:hypothetical protein